MQIDTWPKSADRMMEVVGVVLAGSHVVFLVLIVLWFAMKKPTSVALFRLRLGAALHGKPLPDRLPRPPVPAAHP